jgi:hypothetical protein
MMWTRLAALVAGTALVAAGPALAQESGVFAVVRGSDTVAVEHFTRDSSQLRGSLARRAAGTGERLRYRATVLADASVPLLELSAWRAEDPEDSPARQTTRVIFKDDSVAVDDATRWSGVNTVVLPTRRSALPYLNLSVAFLEQATRRAEQSRGDSAAVPFFNLGGGQTVTGTIRRVGADSAILQLGRVEFRLRVDGEGRILGGEVPSQGLLITRRQGS